MQEVKRIAWENQDIVEDLKNEPHCNKIIKYPYEFTLDTDIDDTSFQIGTYLENATLTNKEYALENEDFHGKRRYINNIVNYP